MIELQRRWPDDLPTVLPENVPEHPYTGTEEVAIAIGNEKLELPKGGSLFYNADCLLPSRLASPVPRGGYRPTPFRVDPHSFIQYQNAACWSVLVDCMA